MRLGELSPRDLSERLGHGGVDLDTGPFVVRIETPIARLGEEIRFLYQDFPLDAGGGLADFHIAVRQPSGPLGLRRWWRRQAMVFLDGAEPFEPLPLSMAVPMLEWSINWCAATQAHQYVMIHSGVVERGGRALVLPGMTGAGKSTLSAALAFRGWRLLSDEFALVRPADGRLAPWPRPISLKNASIDVIRSWAPDAPVTTPVPDTTKGTVAHARPPAASVGRAGELASPAWIVFPTYEKGAATRLAPLPKARAFFRLADSSFNYEFLGIRGFETLSRMIDACDVYALTFAGLDEALRLLDALPPLEPEAATA